MIDVIKDPWIAKEEFDFIFKIVRKLDYESWVEFIDSKKDYFTWKEETFDGIELLKNITLFPIEFRDGILGSLNKSQAFAEYNEKTGHYEVVLTFNRQYGVISTTFQKKIKSQHLRILLDLANYLDAYLLNNGKEIIDELFVQKHS